MSTCMRVAFVVAWLVLPGAARAQSATYRVWPDTPPPCNGTLQACIDGSLADDAIDIATNGPIDEELRRNRSLELAAAPGSGPCSPPAARSSPIRTVAIAST